MGMLGWINQQRVKFQAKPPKPQRQMVSGESHHFLGQRYRLRVLEEGSSPRLTLRGKASMLLTLRPDTTTEKKQEVLHAFYRIELKNLVPELLDLRQPILGVTVSAWE